MKFQRFDFRGMKLLHVASSFERELERPLKGLLSSVVSFSRAAVLPLRISSIGSEGLVELTCSTFRSPIATCMRGLMFCQFLFFSVLSSSIFQVFS